MENLSIKEFAIAVGLTQQAVYKQLKKRLAPYVKEIDGKKYISQEAIKLYSTGLTTNSTELNNQIEKEKPINAGNSKDGIKQFNTQFNQVEQPVEPDRSELELVRSMVETLQKELDRKDALLLEERQRVNDLNDKLAAAYQQIAEMGKASQYITAADKTIQLVEQKPVPDNTETPAATNDVIDLDEASSETGTEKKNFIRRLMKLFNK